MLLSSLVASLLLAAVPALAQDIVYNAEHNVTSIAGTWTTGSRAVSTGSVRAIQYCALGPTDSVCEYRASQTLLTSPSRTPRTLVFRTLCEYLHRLAAVTKMLRLFLSTDDGFYEVARYRFNGNGTRFVVSFHNILMGCRV